MAKRSDFAQKLLDDLRLRKQRMAASQSSNGSKAVVGDAYAYSMQTYRGSKEMTTHQKNSIRTGSMHNRSSKGNKSFSVGEASKEIIPFGKDRGSQKIDLSMALAFAFENGGKLRRMDSSGNNSMFKFLQQLSRRSVDSGKMERTNIQRHHPSSSSFPALSHLHIREISKGAQKLNQILQAFSNGLKFDSYSIEIGKELLKGARDLEESLRMLVNLQEASEFMIRPQSKSTITLLDDDEDDNDNIAKTDEHKQLDRPTFSFDKAPNTSHYIQAVARTDLKHRLMALTYPSESMNFNHDINDLSTSDSVSHKRSNSNCHDVGTRSASSEQMIHLRSSKSKPAKGRIPNVIAKLMGLEDLPENKDTKSITQEESRSKQKVEEIAKRKPAETSTRREQKKKDRESTVTPRGKQMQILSTQTQVIQGTAHNLQTTKNPATQHAGFEASILDGKLPQQMRGLYKANAKPDKHHGNITQLNQSTGSTKAIQQKEIKQDNQKLAEQKGKERSETKEQVIKHELDQKEPQAQKGSEIAIRLQGQTKCNTSTLSTENTDASKLLHNNQPKFPSVPRLLLPNFDLKDKWHHAGDSNQQSVILKPDVRRQTGSQTMSRSLSKPMAVSLNLQKIHLHANQVTPRSRISTEYINAKESKGFANNRQHEDLMQHISSNGSHIDIQDGITRNSNQTSSPGDLKSEFKAERTSITPAKEEKSIHQPASQKVSITKAQKVETPRKIDELVTRKSGTSLNLARSSKHHTSMVQEVKQRKHGQLGGSKELELRRVSGRKEEAEAHTVQSNKPVASTQVIVLAGKQIKDGTFSYSSTLAQNEERPMLGEPEILLLDKSRQSTISVMRNDWQAQAPNFGKEELGSNYIPSDSPQGIYEGGTSTMHSPTEVEPKPETPEPLTESENNLKRVLMKSQVFLNTAEAVFKLNIPFSKILNDRSRHDDSKEKEDDKLMLDCGYEVMKRKGVRQELSTHPLMGTRGITRRKATSLDDLVKQLNGDIQRLRFYGRDGNAACGVEDQLPKLIENDVYNCDPDVNCMWDLGWDKTTLAFLERDDVVRDVERHLLNGLLNEVTIDLVVVF